MRTRDVKRLLGRVLAPLRRVNEALNSGISRAEFHRRFGKLYVSPGMTAWGYFQQQMDSGAIEVSGDILRFKRT